MINKFNIENEDSIIPERMASAAYNSEEDADIEGGLRPKTLDEYIGQEKAKESLRIYIEACKRRGDSLDHVLLYGPPGCGKTLIARQIGKALNAHEPKVLLILGPKSSICLPRSSMVPKF